MEKSVFSFRTVQVGTNKLKHHIRQHTQNRSNANCFVRTLRRTAKQTVARAVVLAFALDVRPLSFCDGYLGISNFAQTLFEFGQTVPVNGKVDPASYLPGKTAAHSAVQEISKERKREFVKAMREGSLTNGGAVSVDGVHFKVSRKHFLYVTVNFMIVKKTRTHDESTFSNKNKTLWLAQEPEVPNSSNIRETLECLLLEKYQTPLGNFL